jgi:hypothetical protein
MVWYIGSKEEGEAIKLLDIELQRASDRAVAILAGSIVEARLTAFLKSQVQDDGKTWEARTHSSAPLGSFAVKIDIAFLFRLITKAAHVDLTNIKDIRNRFAHDLDLAGFNNQGIAAKCGNLKLVETYVIDSPTKEGMPWFTFPPLDDRRFLIGGINANEELTEPRGRFIWAARVFSVAFGMNPLQMPLPRI